jgi:hypothetical protein
MSNDQLTALHDNSDVFGALTSAQYAGLTPEQLSYLQTGAAPA